MRKLNPYIFVLVLVLSFSCLEKSTNDFLGDSIYSSAPIFYFNSNNLEYQIKAGINSFYLFTEFEVDSMNVYSFVARFAKLSTCENLCAEELIIKIRDFQSVSPSTQIQIDESLSVGDYSFTGSQNIGFGDVMIIYTDQFGRTFRSDFIDQNPENYFRILAVSDFQKNENGQPTKKLELSFRCTLSDPVDQEEINFEDAEAVIAVAYPE